MSSSTTTNSNPTQSILSDKVSRALQVRTDTPAMKAALEALAHLDWATLDSRSVRVAIEQDALEQALKLQDELRTLVDSIATLRQGISETAALGQAVSKAIGAPIVVHDTDTSSKELDSITPATTDMEQEQQLALQISQAFLQKHHAKRRYETVAEFLEAFDLREQDSRLLDHYAFEDIREGSTHVNGMAFLQALDRIGHIRTELSKTLQLETQSARHQLGASSALRMMESLQQRQERANEKLYHWLQQYLQLHTTQQDDDDVLDEALSHPFVKRALFVLRNVPAFYSHTLELVAASRRAQVTRRFLLALTSGYSGMTPIEMKAHDAVAYVGDMLAFCFKAFSVEADVAKGLVHYNPNQESEQQQQEDTVVVQDQPETLTDETAALVGEEALKSLSAAELLGHSVSGVARPLKSRILQVVASLARRDDEDEDPDETMEEEGELARTRLAQLYEICGLLLFYASATTKAIMKFHTASEHMDESSINPIGTAIRDCLKEGTTAFEAGARVYAATLDQLAVLTGDSEAVLAQTLVVRIANVRAASPGFATDVEEAFATTLSMEWLCETLLMDAALPNCNSLDDGVAIKQAIMAARKAGMSGTVALQMDEKVRNTETALIERLVESETKQVMDLCGLGAIASNWARWKEVRTEGMVMSSYPGLTPPEVESSMKEFYDSLYSPPIPSFESTIRDPALRKMARSKIADNVCSTYSEMYMVMKSMDKGGYDDLSFLGHTPDQVRTLFSA